MNDFSIIIAAPEFDAQLPVLAALRRGPIDLDRYEIIVTLGRQPSVQRNRAIARARGAVLIFLDSDCQPDAAYFARIEAAFARTDVDILGGPVLLEEGRPPLETIFQAALANPIAVGKTASRYASRGQLRRTGEAELILCNLAVRASVFAREGVFNEALYPNEENEWLDRVAPRVSIWHDPELVVRRPQRASWNEFFATMLRYGAGRTRQTLVSRRWTAKSLPLVALFGWLILSFVARLETGVLTFLFFVLHVSAVAMTCPRVNGCALSWGKRIRSGLAAFGALAYYAFGQLLGLIGWPPQRAPGEIRLVNEAGTPLE